RYLSGDLKINIPKSKTVPPPYVKGDDNFDSGWITIEGASQNNLKNINVSFPVGCLTCVSGISGSGKSTLIDEIFRKSLFRKFYQSKEIPGKHHKICGLNQIDKAVVIDQSPIGRSPR
ncbi:MAG TPA: excinuclease ABC subunit UvrA, partial [Verrucomicrobiales bacterium]|nr:excinuclease ABC subunit UvrA [Verrucomicrobiales bacterium]